MRTLTRHRLVTFAFLFLFSLPWQAFGPGFEFEDGEYELLRDMALETLSRFPPSRYAYVSIGRSPSPIMAIIQEMHGNGHAISIPGSKIKWGRDLGDLNPTQQTSLDNYFNHYLVRLAPMEGRQILLLDHVQSGLSLKRTRDYVKHATAATGNAVAVESLGIVLDKEGLHEHLTEYGMVDHLLKYKPERQLERFASERYDNFAEYGFVSLTQPDSLTVQSERPEYQLLREAARKKMATDPVMRTALAFALGCGPELASVAKD